MNVFNDSSLDDGQIDLLAIDDAMLRLLGVQQRAFSLFVERRAERRPDYPTRIQMHVLHILRERELVSVSELARLLSVSVSTVSQLINTLVERQWLRVDISAQDRRRHDVRLTEAGAALLRDRYHRRLNTMKQVLEQLTPEERTMLVHLLERSVAIWQSFEEGSTTSYGH